MLGFALLLPLFSEFDLSLPSEDLLLAEDFLLSEDYLLEEDLLLEEGLLLLDDSSISIDCASFDSFCGVVACCSFFCIAFFYWLGELVVLAIMALLAFLLALDGIFACCLCFGDLGLVVNFDYRLAFLSLFASCAAAFYATL